MKKALAMIMVFLFLGTVVFSGDKDVDEYTDSFDDLTEDIHLGLPYVTNLGLNWNDAYSGHFPHMGLGLTVGAILLPVDGESLDPSSDDSNKESPFPFLPIPIYSVDGRIGLPVIPMDIGFKVGIFPSTDIYKGTYFELKTFGGDVRWAFFEDRKRSWLPDLSLGLGYTWLEGRVSNTVGDDQTIDIKKTGAGDQLTFKSPEAYFRWQASIFDIKTQVSKKALIFTMSAGLGYSVGVTETEMGLTGLDLRVDGNPITLEHTQQISDYTDLSMDNDGFSILTKKIGGAFRVFGGLGLDIAILNLDFGVLYAIPADMWGASMNIRLQY